MTHHEFTEEQDYFSTHKDARKERKLRIKKDQSKYKKTDLDQKAKTITISPTHGREGIVTHIHGLEIIVTISSQPVICSLRGIFKKERQKLKSLIIVGDRVLVDSDNAIHYIFPRTSILSRADHLSQNKEHLLAANVDLVLITVSVVDPFLRPPIIDRYLISCDKGHLTPAIVCNKIDLLDNPAYNAEERSKEKQLLDECIQIYQKIGFPFFPVSATTGQGIEALQHYMKGKTSVFSGQSGTGKSSIINAMTEYQLKVGDTVASSRKGSHTTSYAALLPLTDGGFIVDTPGIKSFGIWNLDKEEVRFYFPEFAHLQCKFQDCLHLGEEGCNAPRAVEQGLISTIRYNSYLNIIETIEKKHYRR